MSKTEKIKGMLQLLEMNDDLLCYELTSLATKINNFLEDRSRLLSGQWLSVMYVSLSGEDDDEDFEMVANQNVQIDTKEPTMTEDDDNLIEVIRGVEERPFSLV